MHSPWLLDLVPVHTKWVKWSKFELRVSGKCSSFSLQEDSVRLKQRDFNHCSERKGSSTRVESTWQKYPCSHMWWLHTFTVVITVITPAATASGLHSERSAMRDALHTLRYHSSSASCCGEALSSPSAREKIGLSTHWRPSWYNGIILVTQLGQNLPRSQLSGCVSETFLR